MIRLSYIKESQLARVETDQEDGLWTAIERLLADHSLKDFEPGNNFLQLPWWDFAGKWPEVKENLDYYRQEIKFSEEARKLLFQDDERNASAKLFSEKEVAKLLKESGFVRTLKPFQLRNVAKLASLANGAATFSVPGAGKTTEALACYFLRRNPDSKLFVVCPKNAFGVWEREIIACAPKAGMKVIRLTGPSDSVTNKLVGEGDVFLVTYQKFSIEISNIAACMKSSDIMFLDESHYIKRRRGGVWTQSVLRVKHLPGYRLIMSGTPLPNGSQDLVSQFQFLGVPVNPDENDLAKNIEPFYVRTTKKELGIEPYLPVRKPVPLSSGQLSLYRYAKSEEFRQLSGLKSKQKNVLRSMGKSAIRLLQITSNPQLLVNHPYADLGPMRDALSEGPSLKLKRACNRARELAAEGKKCVIWSHFVINVETIAASLSDQGADYIHGGVEAGSEEESDTREAKIKRFHEDDQAMVLVANPAACAEAISLHTVCHNAIYIDRNFNAAQFLQSIDRIHRLGLKRGTKTNVEIFYSPGTIDDVVHTRLETKIKNMERVLMDHSIQPEIEDVELDDDEFFSAEDRDAYLQYLKQDGY